MSIQESTLPSQIESATYGTIGALVLYMCVYGVGSPIPWMITSELFNQKVTLYVLLRSLDDFFPVPIMCCYSLSLLCLVLRFRHFHGLPSIPAGETFE